MLPGYLPFPNIIRGMHLALAWCQKLGWSTYTREKSWAGQCFLVPQTKTLPSWCYRDRRVFSATYNERRDMKSHRYQVHSFLGVSFHLRNMDCQLLIGVFQGNVNASSRHNLV